MLLARKLTNEVHRLMPDAECYLKNIRVNGTNRGCSGTIRLETRSEVRSIYVNTDCIQFAGQPKGFLLRRNDVHKADGSDCMNHWGYLDQPAVSIQQLLTEDGNRWAFESEPWIKHKTDAYRM